MSARKGVVWSFWMLVVAPIGLLLMAVGFLARKS